MTAFRFLLAGTLLTLLYVGTYASLNWITRQVVIDKMVEAAQAGDATAIAKRIKWNSLQIFVRRDLERKSRAISSSTMGVTIGPPVSKIGDLVGFYIQPKNVDMVLRLRHKVFPEYEPVDFIRDISFAGPFAFAVTLSYPHKEDDTELPLFTEQMMAVTFIFELDGWTWRIKEMHVPLFMVPMKPYDEEAIESFLLENPL